MIDCDKELMKQGAESKGSQARENCTDFRDAEEGWKLAKRLYCEMY